MQITTFLSHLLTVYLFLPHCSPGRRIGIVIHIPNLGSSFKQYSRWPMILIQMNSSFSGIGLNIQWFQEQTATQKKKKHRGEAIKYWNNDRCVPESCLRKKLMNFKGIQTYRGNLYSPGNCMYIWIKKELEQTGFLEYFRTMKCLFHYTSIMQNVKYSLQRKSSRSQRGKEGLKVKEEAPLRSDRMSESRAPPCPWLFIYFYS